MICQHFHICQEEGQENCTLNTQAQKIIRPSVHFNEDQTRLFQKEKETQRLHFRVCLLKLFNGIIMGNLHYISSLMLVSEIR